MTAGLGRWLASRDPPAQLVGVTRAAAGMSSETWFVDLTPGPRLVIRLAPPADIGLFPVYDLELQGRIQNRLAAAGVPAVPPVAYVEDESWVGRPFLVMAFVPGAVVADDPPYSRSGWLHDAPPSTQRQVMTGFLDALAALHRTDWTAADLALAARPAGTGLGPELDWWDDYLQWASGGDVRGELADAVEWCRRHIPQPEPPASMLWGDPRLANVIFGDDHRPVALVDWEMATIAPAEVDLGWFLALRPSRPELPGFPDRDGIIAHYSARLGRTVGDLTWYERFALIRSTAVLIRVQKTVPPGHWLTGVDPIPPRLRSAPTDP